MKGIVLLLLIFTTGLFAQETSLKPITVIAKLVAFEGCDKLCSATYEVVKITESDGYPLQDTISVGFKNPSKQFNPGSCYTLILNRYTECANVPNYYILPGYDYNNNVQEVTSVSLIPKKKVVYTVKKLCESNSWWFGSFVMESPAVEAYLRDADFWDVTTDTVTTHFEFMNGKLMWHLNLDNKLLMSREKVEKLVQLFFENNKTLANLKEFYICDDDVDKHTELSIFFEVKDVK